MRNSNVTGGGATLPGGVEDDSMSDFDALPRRIREAMRHTIVQWSARKVLTEILPYARKRYPGQEIEAVVRYIQFDEANRVHGIAAERGEVPRQPDKLFRLIRRRRTSRRLEREEEKWKKIW